MPKLRDLFRASRGEDRDPKAQRPGFTIDIEFIGGLSATQQAAFKGAAIRWTRIIVGDLPQAKAGGRRIDDLLIFAQGKAIDGLGGILGQAGPGALRPGSFLPITGTMTFDVANLEAMEADGRLEDVITHEMGHCLGFGMIWHNMGLVQGVGTDDPVFVGPKAQHEYGLMIGAGPTPVPLANTGLAATQGGHWRDSVFDNELMTGQIAKPGNPISRITVATLADMGYKVDMAAAEPYALPLPPGSPLGNLVVERPPMRVAVQPGG